MREENYPKEIKWNERDRRKQTEYGVVLCGRRHYGVGALHFAKWSARLLTCKFRGPHGLHVAFDFSNINQYPTPTAILGYSFSNILQPGPLFFFLFFFYFILLFVFSTHTIRNLTKDLEQQQSILEISQI